MRYSPLMGSRAYIILSVGLNRIYITKSAELPYKKKTKLGFLEDIQRSDN